MSEQDMNKPVRTPSGWEQVLSQSQANASDVAAVKADVANIKGEFSNFRKDVVDGLSAINKKIDRGNRTDFATLALWATVIIMILGGIGSVLGLFIFRELDSLAQGQNRIEAEQKADVQGLDSKLQRENQQIAEKQQLGLDNVEKASRERHDDVEKAFDRIKLSIVQDETRQWDLVRDDLQELRQRRIEDGRKR